MHIVQLQNTRILLDQQYVIAEEVRVSAERLVRFGDGLWRTRREVGSTGPFMPALRHGTKGGLLCFPSGVAKGRWVVLLFEGWLN
jgi:hypothetical protein